MNRNQIAEFKKKFHLVRKLFETELAGHSMNLEFKMDSSGSTSDLTAPPDSELGRLALLIRPFADAESSLFFEKICDFLTETPCYADEPKKKSALAKHAADVRDSGIRLQLNEKKIDGPNLFRIYVLGGYIEEQQDYQTILKALNKPIGPSLLRFFFFSYCLNVFNLCTLLYNELRNVERLDNDLPDQKRRQGPCIYCRGLNGGFSTEEHIYPESLGNDEITLPPGMVCDKCNNGVLSGLDDYLVNHDLVSFLRTVFVPINPKTGRYPKGKSQRFSFERNDTRKIRLETHGLSEKQIDNMFREADDGTVEIKLPVVGRKPMDAPQLGRSLFKIGIGAIAYHEGPNACLDPRYDMARDYIMGNRDFPNSLVIARDATPLPIIKGSYQKLEPKGTMVAIELFGITFGFNLEEEPPLMDTTGEGTNWFGTFPLWKENE